MSWWYCTFMRPRKALAAGAPGEAADADRLLSRLRDARTLGERLRRAGEAALAALWRGFQVAFKIWIAATLVGYTVLFLLLALALSLAAEDDTPVGLVFWFLPDWVPAG